MTDVKTENLPLIGILGDGQLAMMMIEAYQALGGKVYVFGASEISPASSVADRVFVGDVNDAQALTEFFNAVDVVTLENEFNDSGVLSQAVSQCSTPMLPNPDRFALIEDKLSEKKFFENLGINQATFFEVTSEDQLINTAGYLKIAKGGYDGIGTYRVDNKQEALSCYRKIKSSGTILFETAVDFKKELSLIAVSNQKDIVFYPIVETHQEQGTCRYVTYPAQVSESIEQQARTMVGDVLRKLDTSGLFAFELFLTSDDHLILNESAPRPHNSGHITMDLMDYSQFENHMRAVAGMELKAPKAVKESMTMINLLGTREGEFDEQALMSMIDDPQSSTTLYRKSHSRMRRKMGHINIWGSNQQQRAHKLVKELDV